MAGKPVATIGNMHVCPMVTGLTPHVGGPITGPGIPGILIDGKPVAVMGDMCVCTGPPDVIVTGSPGVLADGKPIVLMGDMTAHGGQVVEGVPGVTVGSGSMKPAVIPLKEIPFPKISALSRLVAPKQVKEAEERINQVKALVESEDDKPKRIFNVQWEKDDITIDNTKYNRKITLSADTWGYQDGEKLTFQVHNKEDNSISQIPVTVQDNHIETEWETNIDNEENL